MLSSRWSHVANLPVSIFAVGLYALMLLMLWHIRPGSKSRVSVHQSASALLVMSSVAVVVAVAWFAGLQAWVIGSWCRYCSASHVAGLVAAILLLQRLRFSKTAALPGMMGVVLLISLQVLLPAPGFDVNRFNATHAVAFDIGKGDQRLVGLLDGTLIFKPSDVPHLGSLGASIVMAEIMDYTCPHCKELQEQLDTLQVRSGQSFLIMILPTPLSSACNPNLKATGPGHQDACRIATYMLQLWFENPVFFQEAHKTVMRSDAYTWTEVKAVIEQANGGSLPALSITSEKQAAELIERNVQLQQRLGPAMPQLAVGTILIRGRPYSVEELASVIDESQASDNLNPTRPSNSN